MPITTASSKYGSDPAQPVDSTSEEQRETLRLSCKTGEFPVSFLRVRKPLAIDLFCGLGGWAEGLLAAGWDVIGFDIERHVYPSAQTSAGAIKRPGLNWSDRSKRGAKDATFNRPPEVDGTGKWMKYPSQLVIQDVLTLHGSQFRNAGLIVASPPCQEFSYMAMPWSRGKQIAAALRGERGFPAGYEGSNSVAQLNALFDACFRIQSEASEAAGRHIPMVVENVKGAEPWVGPAKANYGSFFLWGDVGMANGNIVVPGARYGQFLRPPAGMKKTGCPSIPLGELYRQGVKVAGITTDHLLGRKTDGFNFHQHEKTGKPGGSFQSAAVKNFGGSWFNVAHNTTSGTGRNPVNGVKQHGSGAAWSDKALDERRKQATAIKDGGDWFSSGEGMSAQRRTASGSTSRKAASALIAKIPFDLAQWIGKVYLPREELKTCRTCRYWEPEEESPGGGFCDHPEGSTHCAGWRPAGGGA